MVETAGNKLRRARQTRHLSLEDAARATKIRESQLADLEADEYSNFANLAYARSYLVNYGKYLRVDMRPWLESFSDTSTFGLDDYQYLSEKPVGVYRIPYRRSTQARRPRRRQLIGGAVVLAVLAVGLYAWLLSINIRRLGDPNNLSARLAAREKVARGEAGTDAAAPVAVPAVVAVPATATGITDANGGEAAKAAATGEIIPVSAPASAPTADTPAPSAAPVPAEAPAQDSIPALATATVSSVALPLSGDGRVVRELLTAHNAQPQPQKVVNDQPRGR